MAFMDGGSLRNVDRLVLRMHRRARQRHPVLPAHQRAQHPIIARPCRKRAAIALSPDQPLAVSRHQLAVQPTRAITTKDRDAVVKRVAGALSSQTG